MRETHLRGNLALAQQLSHQAILEIAEPSAFLEMVLGQEHVPQTELLSLCLERLHDGRGSLPSLLAFAQLGGEDGVCGDAVLFDEFLDLYGDGRWLADGILGIIEAEVYQVEGLLRPIADKGLCDRGDTG